MKKILKITFIIFSIIGIVSLYSSSSYANTYSEIQPLSSTYIIETYMSGDTYRTRNFTKTSSTSFTVNGKVTGSNVNVSLIDATTGKQVGETKTMINGEIDGAGWSSSLIPNGHEFYYKFEKTNIFSFFVYLDVYVLY